MKANTVLTLAIGAIGVNAQAQEITDLSNCGKICVSSMFGKAGEFGCRPTDASCFCKDANFMNGVIDCSRESCSEASDADQAIQFAVDTCAQAGVVVKGGNGDSGAAGPGQVSTAGPGASGTGAPSAIPVSTSTTVAVVEESGSSVTKTIESTIMSQPIASGSDSTSTSTPQSGNSRSTTVSSSPTTTESGAATSTEDTGFAQKTAVPAAGLLAAVGLAALLI